MSTSFDDKFRYIRSQVDQKSAIPGLTSLASCTPAIKRTGSRLITRFPKSRKIENEITRPKPFGFLAPSHEPYKPYGLPASGEFDVFDWLSYSLHVKPPRNQTSYMRKGNEKYRQVTSEAKMNYTINVPILQDYNKEKIVSDSSVTDNGSSLIFRHLDKLRAQQKKIVCGSSYMETLNKTHCHNKEVVHANTDCTIPLIQPPANVENTNEISASNTSFEIARPLYDAKHCLIKLKSIYSILCFLSNVKSKDLKTKAPLTLDYLNYLCLKPHFNLLKVQEQYCVGRNNNNTADANKQQQQAKMIESNGSDYQRYPPWQYQIVFVNISDKEKETDLRKRMTTCYEAFEQLKKDLGYKLKHQLKARSKNIPQQLLHKMQELQYGPSPIRQLQQMRDRSCMHSVMNQVKRNIKPRWYLMLQNELDQNILPESLCNGKALMEKIHQFIIFDANAIASVLEKFCLYVMSLPAYELCTRPVIDAVMFVLEHILHISPKLCNEWLSLRRLPWQQ